MGKFTTVTAWHQWHQFTTEDKFLKLGKDAKQAEAELGQAQLNWTFGFAEAEAELDNNSSS